VHRLDVGAQLRFATGPAPGLMPGLGLTAGWERDAASVLSLKVQLVVARHALDGWYGPGGTAAFTLDLATLHLCPIRLGTPDARARLCASAAAGRMVAESMDNLSPRTRSRPFVGVGAAALLSASPHPRVEVAVSIEPQAALIRDQFTFGPNLFHHVPAIVWFFGAGATVTFP
jgi:hypothetical protein